MSVKTMPEICRDIILKIEMNRKRNDSEKKFGTEKKRVGNWYVKRF